MKVFRSSLTKSVECRDSNESFQRCLQRCLHHVAYPKQTVWIFFVTLNHVVEAVGASKLLVYVSVRLCGAQSIILFIVITVIINRIQLGVALIHFIYWLWARRFVELISVFVLHRTIENIFNCCGANKFLNCNFVRHLLFGVESQ